ncbi:MAG: FAD-binding protein, partial [Deltaproteobacteria bacterium]|nr:FAD-binding protein [Deltaproteobacteria bacterium]
TELVGQWEKAVKDRGISVLLNTKAQRIIKNTANKVVGIEAVTAGQTLNLGARRGVVFGTGGFAHNAELRRKFLGVPTNGSCAVKESEGDFITMARVVGADLEGPAHGWWAEIVLEEALAGPIANDVWAPPGDSMILVNRYGERVISEKLPYHVRTPIHFHWDPVRGEFPNLLLVMVYDQRTAEKFGASGTVSYPSLTPDTSYVISGNTLGELSEALRKRLASIARLPGAPSFQLAPEFTNSLQKTIQRFNQFAVDGVDQDFRRGEIPIEKDLYFHQGGATTENQLPNPTMHPIADRGPFHAIILAAGMLDTHGGPRINTRAQVLNSSGEPIPGLYGAGNCVTGPAGRAYWGAGATLGLAMTFGYIAAQNVSMEPQREIRRS